MYRLTEAIVRQIATSLAIATLVVFGICGGLNAETFILANGGQVEGELLNPDEIPRQNYVVRTPLGAEITLTPDQVKQVVRRRPEEVEYDAIRHSYPDTVEGQWELAEWCRQRQLLAERKTHLERILELDPDNLAGPPGPGLQPRGRQMDDAGRADARRRLSPLQGPLADGSKRSSLMEESQQKKNAEGQWKQRLKQWRDWLGTGRISWPGRTSRRSRIPSAVKALAYALKDDPRDEARLMYLEALARIGTTAARRILADLGD